MTQDLLKSAQKRWDRLEAGGDNAFAQSPASAATPRTLRQSHRDVRAYAAQRVEALEKDVKTTRREATLATADLNGISSARMVLLKHADEQGFIFYTNLESQKGNELKKNVEKFFLILFLFLWLLLIRHNI